jgi:Tfp pilus assembly protein PilX
MPQKEIKEMKMRHIQKNRVRKDSGYALILALLLTVILSALAAAVVFQTQTEISSTSNYRLLTQARYVAEAGANQAGLWISQNAAILNAGSTTGTYLSTDGSTPVFPVASAQTAFNTAMTAASQAVPTIPNSSFTVNAELLNDDITSASGPLQTWMITSVGSVKGLRTARVQVKQIIQRGFTVGSLPGFGAVATGTGCGAMTFSGNISTDSYNSSNGTYAATHTNAGGNVATNGNLTASTGVTIHGELLSPLAVGAVPCGPVTGTPTIDGGVKLLHVDLNYSVPPYNGTGTPDYKLSGKTDATLAPGSYGTITISGQANIHLTNGCSPQPTPPATCNIPGIYNFKGFSGSGNGALIVDSGPVVINFDPKNSSPVSASGNWFSNPTGVSTNFTINYGGTGTMQLSGNADTYGKVIAPNANLTFSGNAQWYGQVVGKSVTGSGNGEFHYDNALGSTVSLDPGAMHITYFTWNKY